MRSRLAVLVVALLLPLMGCGDQSASYCSELKADNKKLADMIGSDSPTALLDGLPTLRALSKKAPDDLTDEWQTYLGALDGLEEALKDAGVKASDYKGGKAPAGMSVEDQKKIADAAGQISTDAVLEASNGIEQQGRDVCKVNLGL